MPSSNRLRGWSVPAICLLAFVLVESLGPAQASAGGKDLVLRRLADREAVVVNGEQIGYNAIKDTKAFRQLSLDLGLVFAPKFMAPAETLGEAGFDVGVGLSVNSVAGSGEQWRALDGSSCRLGATDCGAEDPGTFMTGIIHVRKGLPFSFEMGGSLTYLFDSELVGLGTEIKWALNEGFFVLPDFAVRGTVNNVVGSSDMNLTTAGFDTSVSKSFGVAGTVNVTPYLGYNRLWIVSSSRLLDAAPEDPTPPTLDPQTDELLFQPEFVFDQEVQSIDRFFFGSRFVFVRAVVTLEAAISGEVDSYTARVGFDF